MLVDKLVNGSLVSFFELWLLSASDRPSRCQWYAISLKLTMQLRCKVNAEASSLGLRWAAARSRRCIFITTAKVPHSHCGSRMISKKFRFFAPPRSFGHLVICQNRKQMLSKPHYNINIYIYIIVSKWPRFRNRKWPNDKWPNDHDVFVFSWFRLTVFYLFPDVVDSRFTG